MRKYSVLAPFVVHFAGFDSDPRAVYDIPKARMLCQGLVSTGLISLMEVTTQAKELRTMNDWIDSYSLGALEVWLVATNRHRGNGTFVDKRLIGLFYDVLSIAHGRCDKVLKQAA